MKSDAPHRWPECWREIESYIWRLQRRVYDAESRDDRHTVERLQRRIAASFFAKLLAVRKVAQKSPGRKTAGPDGVASPTEARMFDMARRLSIHHAPSAVRRELIPKPGKQDMRILGIPNLMDRAHQVLIEMALAPQWEARFSSHQYGFRRGRSPHDAMDYVRRHLRGSGPKWCLDADIEKFFDRLDHTALMSLLDCSSEIAGAAARALRSGAIHDGLLYETDRGTPQGGPLSPLLANIALAGLESHVLRAFDRDFAGRITLLGRPAVAIYADDLIVLHKVREVVEWAQPVIDAYLRPLGLNLSTSKTRIVHTDTKVEPTAKPGFDFLGFHFQHHLIKERGHKLRPYLLVTPSEAAIQRFYRDCADRIDLLKLSKKRRGERRNRQRNGALDPVTRMVKDLNRSLQGWANYYRRCNAKQAFTKLDSLLHQKLQSWSKRRFPGKTVAWRVDNLFSGVETDPKGNPLLRVDGSPRKRHWVFKSPFVDNAMPHVTLRKLSNVQIEVHILVQAERSFYDGDWSYWQKRLGKRRYPGLPRLLNASAFHRQKGACPKCRLPLLCGESLTFATSEQGKAEIIHATCPHHRDS